jgi:hypothetical protein
MNTEDQFVTEESFDVEEPFINKPFDGDYSILAIPIVTPAKFTPYTILGMLVALVILTVFITLCAYFTKHGFFKSPNNNNNKRSI